LCGQVLNLQFAPENPALQIHEPAVVLQTPLFEQKGSEQGILILLQVGPDQPELQLQVPDPVSQVPVETQGGKQIRALQSELKLIPLHEHFPVVGSQVPLPEQLLGQVKFPVAQAAPEYGDLQLQSPVDLSHVPCDFVILAFQEQLRGQFAN
jgi:hypothetical protein